MAQTGDCGVGANCLLVGGYSGAPIPLDWPTSSDWFEELRISGGRLVTDGKS